MPTDDEERRGLTFENRDPEMAVLLTARGLEANIEAHGGVLGSKLFIDATVKWHRHPRQGRWGGARIAPVEPPPSADVEKVRQRWAEYGFGEY